MIDPLIAEISSTFLYTCVGLALAMLIWDTIEVGRNDAANLVNAVFGARILRRDVAVWVAGAGVVLGATFSSDVIDTARKGIFDPLQLSLYQAFAVYTAVYIVDTVLLYSYSAFGMPVSTTACLVFELLGAAFALKGFKIVYWGTAGDVVIAIICSIAISCLAGFVIQRILRGAIRERCQEYPTLRLHGGWAGGAMLAALTYFMMVKGMKSIEAVHDAHEGLVTWVAGLSAEPDSSSGMIIATWILFAAVWAFFGILIHVFLLIYQEKGARVLFPVIAVVGMICMGFAFGQNDLANCASPGLAAYNLYEHQDVAKATRVDVNRWLLFGCGFLLLFGMTTKNAQRVTRAEVHTGSMSHNVALWAPDWCITLARILIRLRRRAPTLAPPSMRTPAGKRMHYDSLRASVILTVSASVIATASSLGLPVSTTYVAFAAVIATGAADRIMQRGDAELKLARTIWVMFSWFASAIIAAVCAAGVCLLVYKLGVVGTLTGVGINLVVRRALRRRADLQEQRVREAARERQYPEEYAEPEV